MEAQEPGKRADARPEAVDIRVEVPVTVIRVEVGAVVSEAEDEVDAAVDAEDSTREEEVWHQTRPLSFRHLLPVKSQLVKSLEGIESR